MKSAVALALFTALAIPVAAQQGPPAAGGQRGRGGAAGRGGPGAAPPFGAAQGAPSVSRGAQAAAPIDLTGYWVAVVSEDWRWRMVTPARGDYASIPITQAAKDVADRWDPAKDAASGQPCKSYGPPGLMRAPTRLHITWQDERTLKVDSDYGRQTRLLKFGPRAGTPGPATLQGDSVASWEAARRGGGAGRGGPPPMSGDLKVVTTNMTPGYLRKNGVPYSANATFTEYWDTFTLPTGDRWIIITAVVHDPQFLQTDWITSLNFKKEPDGARWDPTACSTTW
jgi:hypothetical protein